MTHIATLTTFRLDRHPAARSARVLAPGSPSHPIRHPFHKATLHFQDLLLFVPVLLFSVIAHEYAHGYAALKQGDTTALMLGRLTWNPAKHIDPFMTVLLPAMLYMGTGGKVMLGGAKPVPVNPNNYREPRRGDLIVSLAGVFVNFLIAIGSVVVFVLVGLLGRATPGITPPLAVLQAMAVLAVQTNLLLLAFNLIPIPPLDGSHVVKYLLPPAWSVQYQRVGRYGIVVLILLLYSGGNLLNAWMRPVLAIEDVLLRWADPFSLPALRQWLT